MRARTGRAAPEVARAYLIVRDVFDLPRAVGRDRGARQQGRRPRCRPRCCSKFRWSSSTPPTWLLQQRRLDIAGDRARLGPNVAALAAALPSLLPPRDGGIAAARALHFSSAGVADALAAQIGALTFLEPALDIAELAETAAQPLERTARVYYAVGERFSLYQMRAAARGLPAETQWQKLAIDVVLDDLWALQADLAGRVLASEQAGELDPAAAWAAAHAADLDPAEAVSRELSAGAGADLALLIVAARRLRQALGRSP